MNLSLVTFGDGSYKWRLAASRLQSEAKLSRKFCNIHKFSIKNLSLASKEDLALMNMKVKGVGLWIWKPLTILEAVKADKKADFFWYADAGCDINPGKERDEHFETLIECIKEKKGLFFKSKYNELEFNKPESLDFFSKQFKYFPKSDEKQIVATSFILARDFAVELCEEWINYSRLDGNRLLVDFNNDAIHHRHDQSILSLILKAKYNIEDSNNLCLLDEKLVDYSPNNRAANKSKFLLFSRNRSPVPYLWRRC